MFSCLILRQSQINCQFQVGKTRILLIFSWANDFRKKISTEKIVVVKHVVAQFLNLLFFVILHLPKSCLVLVAYDKTNIPCLFLFVFKTKRAFVLNHQETINI